MKRTTPAQPRLNHYRTLGTASLLAVVMLAMGCMGEAVAPAQPGGDPAATSDPEPLATENTEHLTQPLVGDLLGWFPGVVDRIIPGAKTLLDVLIQVHIRLWSIQFTGGYSLIQGSVTQGSTVTWNMREQICTNTGGQRLVAKVKVSACVGGIQRIEPDGMPEQPQTCEGNIAASEYVGSPQCIYRDPDGLYMWDDGPSIPPEADAILATPLLSGPHKPYALIFWPAGQQHDYCYHHGRITYGYTREGCDDEFHATMRTICQQNHPWWSAFNRQACLSAAAVMYDAVRVAGASAFNKTNTRVNYLKAHATPGSHIAYVEGGPAGNLSRIPLAACMPSRLMDRECS